MTDREYYPWVTTPRSLAITIREACNFYTGVPDSVLAPVIDLLPGYVPAPRENHAVAVAFGVRLGGGRPCVLTQNSGLGLCVDVLFGLQNLYKLGVLFIVSHRGELSWEELQHHEWGRKTNSILRIMGIRSFNIQDKMDVVRVAANYAFGKERPTAVVIHRGNLG